MAFGLTTAGFIPKTLGDVRTSLRAKWRGIFGEAVNVEEESRNGQEIDILSEAISEPWALLESIYHAFEPAGAAGQLLDNLLAISGLLRKAATKTRVTATLTGDAGTVVVAGKVLSLLGLGTRFASIANAAAMVAAADWSALANGTVVVAGVFYWVNDGGTKRVYVVLTGGNIGTPKGTPAGVERSIAIGAAIVAYVGDGDSTSSAVLDAEATGPKPAYAFTLTEIETSVSGWKGAANLLDHTTLGSNIESDSAARMRREISVAKPGKSPLDDLRAEVLNVVGVTACEVFENAGDATVGVLTPHSVEVLVEGGAAQAIVNAIGTAKTGGGGLVGTSSGTFTDSQANDHAIKYSRPDVVDIWAIIPLKKNPAVYPTDGDAQVKQLVATMGDALGLGRDVVASQVESFVWGIPGVLDVGPVLIGLSNPPVASTTLVLTTRQRANFDTARITVNATDSEP